MDKINFVNNSSPYINATNLNRLQTNIETAIEDIFNRIYPIGSIYTSVNSINPHELFGGTWEQIKDTFLLSAGDTYPAGSTGGEATHTLTINELPEHNHAIYIDDPGTGGKWGPTGTVQQSTSRFTSTGNAGGNQPHNNMPPYLVVYVWKRTA